jgi:NADH:ubiquinone oxidoreductase subunit B-like Fe-S oxidoreductase
MLPTPIEIFTCSCGIAVHAFVCLFSQLAKQKKKQRKQKTNNKKQKQNKTQKNNKNQQLIKKKK